MPRRPRPVLYIHTIRKDTIALASFSILIYRTRVLCAETDRSVASPRLASDLRALLSHNKNLEPPPLYHFLLQCSTILTVTVLVLPILILLALSRVRELPASNPVRRLDPGLPIERPPRLLGPRVSYSSRHCIGYCSLLSLSNSTSRVLLDVVLLVIGVLLLKFPRDVWLAACVTNRRNSESALLGRERDTAVLLLASSLSLIPRASTISRARSRPK